MRELDLLMSGWLDRHYAASSPGLQAQFRRLIDTPDPVLLAWLTGRERPDDPGLEQLIDAMRAD